MTWNFRALSITQRLVGLAAIALVPAAAALIYFIAASHRQSEDEASELALRVGELVSLELERIIAGTEGTLYALANAPVVQSFDRESCSAYLDAVKARLPELRRLVAVDSTGLVRCGSALPAVPLDLSDRAYFAEVMASDGLVIGEFTRSKLDGHPVLPLALPLLEGDVVAGAVVTGLDLAWLGARLKDREFFEGSAITIADRNGVILAREPLPERFVGTRIPEAFQPLVRAARPGGLTVMSQDGTRRFIGYYPPAATGTGLYVSAGISTEAALAPIWASTRRSLAIAAGGAAATFGIAWLVGDRLIRRPIARILGTVDAWRGGDTAARTGIARSQNELDRLGAAIDDYMDALAVDRAARRQAEATRTLLVGELEHRVKNVLAVIQSIAAQTFRDQATRESLKTFRQRLAAMSETHAMLSSENWESADLRVTLETALRPFGLGDALRVALDGPRLQITARAALAVSMAVHELATNAVKYGALSDDGGEVAVAWRLRAAPEGERFALTWTERNGPAVDAPGPAGFGSRMIEAALGQELSGRVELSFPPEGAVFTLDAPAALLLAAEPARTAVAG